MPTVLTVDKVSKTENKRENPRQGLEDLLSREDGIKSPRRLKCLTLPGYTPKKAVGHREKSLVNFSDSLKNSFEYQAVRLCEEIPQALGEMTLSRFHTNEKKKKVLASS